VEAALSALQPHGGAPSGAALAAAFSGCDSEVDVLRVACVELHQLAPRARAVAVAAFDAACDAAAPARVAACEAAAGAAAERRLMHDALLAVGAPADGAAAAAAAAPTAAAHVRDAVHSGGEAWLLEDSRDWPAGGAAFADWRAAAGDASSSSSAAVFLTAPLVLNGAVLGVLCLRLPDGACGAASGDACPAPSAEALRVLCLAAAAALGARRERDAADAARAALSLAQDVFPSHIVAQMQRVREARASTQPPPPDAPPEEAAEDG
jgi:hypothetical protein